MKPDKTYDVQMPMVEAQRLRIALRHIRIIDQDVYWGHVWCKSLLHGMIVVGDINDPRLLEEVWKVNPNIPVTTITGYNERYICTNGASCQLIRQRVTNWRIHWKIWFSELSD